MDRPRSSDSLVHIQSQLRELLVLKIDQIPCLVALTIPLELIHDRPRVSGARYMELDLVSRDSALGLMYCP